MSSQLQQACEENDITITSQHLYVDYGGVDGDKYPRDKWVCTIHYKDRSATFEFSMGSGDRVLARGVKKEGQRKYITQMGDVAFGDKQAIDKGFLVLKRVKGKIVGPNVADVLSCLLSDAEACETTFDDWCSNFGSNNDSLQTLNTYLACQRSGSKVIKLLGHTLFKELQGKEH